MRRSLVSDGTDTKEHQSWPEKLRLSGRGQQRLELLYWLRERLIGLSGIPLSVLLGVKADDQEDYEESQE